MDPMTINRIGQIQHQENVERATKRGHKPERRRRKPLKNLFAFVQQKFSPEVTKQKRTTIYADCNQEVVRS